MRTVWKVPYVDLAKEFRALEPQMMDAASRVLSSGEFILRGEVTRFENAISQLFDFPFVIGLNSGTDALYLALRVAGLGPGDEVITSAYTFVATVAAIKQVGATPVFADIDDDFNTSPASIEAKLSPRTRALLPVHLNGRLCDMRAISGIARQNALCLIEDAAQAIGARYDGRPAGGFGEFGCFSLHPLKILNAAGDAGFLCVKSERDAERIRLLRNHGQRSKEEIACFGWNSRLDNLQAAFLNVKIPQLPFRLFRRRQLAKGYQEKLETVVEVRLPPPPVDGGLHFDVYSAYVIRCRQRDELAAHLRQMGIEVFVHWPRPLHRQPELGLSSTDLPRTEALAREALSLPLFPEMEEAQQEIVVKEIKRFYVRN